MLIQTREKITWHIKGWQQAREGQSSMPIQIQERRRHTRTAKQRAQTSKKSNVSVTRLEAERPKVRKKECSR